MLALLVASKVRVCVRELTFKLAASWARASQPANNLCWLAGWLNQSRSRQLGPTAVAACAAVALAPLWFPLALWLVRTALPSHLGWLTTR